ncbi:radical SAM family protein [Lachnotalea glycerini]|uniref:Radical SAM family protein n=1 Tax=Lachnotalea glycerini TaxID=1763509 RepID=A0A318F0F5_9FIRM|nr:radical SAM protein [Lachnotalea glycerini]PXV93854.1 radical SAM family protein [Lachnotalea glycerini]
MKTLTINVHYQCNAKCIFCVVGIPDKVKEEKCLSLDAIYQELQKGIEKGCDSLCLSGGEPTIYDGIINVVSKAKQLGYKRIEIKTNGIKLSDKELVKDFSEAGVDIFCISVQGHNTKIHDNVVGVPGAFSHLLKAVEHVKNENKILYTPTCIQIANYKYLPDIAEFYKTINSDIICPTFIEPSGSANINFADVVPMYSQVIPYLYKAIEIINETNIKWNLHGFPLCMIKDYESKSLDVVDKTDVLAGTDIDNYSDYEKVTYRKKELKCNKCSLNIICNGPWKSYVDKYGFNEFQINVNSLTEIFPPQILIRKFFVH